MGGWVGGWGIGKWVGGFREGGGDVMTPKPPLTPTPPRKDPALGSKGVWEGEGSILTIISKR